MRVEPSGERTASPMGEVEPAGATVSAAAVPGKRKRD
jgi:hypothetical protein